MTKPSFFRSCLLGVTLVALVMSISDVSRAAPVTENFAFHSENSSVVASGSFTYDSALSGTISFSDLSTFTFTYPALAISFDKNFVNSLSVEAGDYVYFGYNIAAKAFVSQLINGFGNEQATLLAANNGYFGFFVDPLPNGTESGGDGLVTIYTPSLNSDGVVSMIAATYDISAPVAAIPEPATWALMIVGFFGLSVLRLRKVRPSALSTHAI